MNTGALLMANEEVAVLTCGLQQARAAGLRNLPWGHAAGSQRRVSPGQQAPACLQFCVTRLIMSYKMLGITFPCAQNTVDTKITEYKSEPSSQE